MSDRRVPIPFASLLGGGILLSVAALTGFSEIYTSVICGWQTRGWPSTPGEAYVAKVASARLWFCPKCQYLMRPYYYQINGNYYHGARYDVHGAFVGTRGDIEKHVKNNPSSQLIVFYDPDNPFQSVLKPGISFDRISILCLQLGVVGMAMMVIGIHGLCRHKKHTANGRQNDPPPIQHSL